MSDVKPGKKLNRKTDDGIRWFIENARDTVAKGEVRGEPATMWDGHFKLATHLYQQIAPDAEVRGHFVAAATYVVRAWEEREPPSATTSTRTPWMFGVMLGVAAAFGDAEVRRRAGEIERWKWFAPENDFYLRQADSLAQLQAFLRGELDATIAAQVVVRSKAENADRHAARFDGPLVDALLAIRGRELDAALQTMVKEHEYRAMHGELQKLSDGLVAVLPLGLVRLARDAGVLCTVDSPYVPVELL